MQVPYFFQMNAHVGEQIELDEASARHAVQVLRMQPGQSIQLTNGEGLLWDATITEAGKKKCIVTITEEQLFQSLLPRKVSIGIAPVKNTNRLEWFLEKVTEMGVSEVLLLQTRRTEKQHLRFERLLSIANSALLQSRQVWLPRILPPQSMEKVLASDQYQHRYIAHCEDLEKQPLSKLVIGTTGSSLLLIGPEGDFDPAEIESSVEAGFVPVSLGQSRLRTETAGVVGAALLCQL
jgi:16S rRNA (uracil1498-N3)-methyltransferase